MNICFKKTPQSCKIKDNQAFYTLLGKYEAEVPLKQTDIRLRLYKTVLMAGIGFSIFSVIGNFIAQFPFELNYKWLFLFAISTIALHFADNEKISPHFMFVVFTSLIFIFLPLGFFASGGSQNNASGYAIVILITVNFIFTEQKRRFLVSALTLVFISLLIVEYNFPGMVSVHPKESQFIDRMIQVPLLIVISHSVLNLFAKEYERMNQKLIHFAHRDELTGLFNRRAFNRTMDALKISQNDNMHLVMIDLDNFKQINDLFGHHTGDAVLVKFSGLLKEAFDLETHMVSRWGGDEFAIIYSGELDHLMTKMQEVKKSFRTYVSKYNESTDISHSLVSLGHYNSGAESLVAADHLLYVEKNRKPNRTL